MPTFCKMPITTPVMRRKDDPLVALFEAASLSGASLDPVATDSPKGASGGSAQHLHITSESQWRTFANSLASEGLVIELSEQQQLQKLWDRAVVGANSFGRKGTPALSIGDVHRCVDEMYRDETSEDIDCKISNAHESVTELQALLDTWNMESFNHTQTRQALQVVNRLEESHRKSVEGLRKEQDQQKGAFITESVLRLIGGEGQSQRGGLHDGDGRSANGATEGESGENLAAGRAYTPCNPLVWQVSNAGLVDHKVAKARVRSIRYPGGSDAPYKQSAHHRYGGSEDDPWGVSQGLAGSQAILCRRGFANRPNCSEEIPVTVVVMPKAGTDYPAREKLWRAFLAHRQLAVGSCVMRSLGVADRDPEETLFYFEHVRARSASVLLSRRRLQEGDLLFRHWARGALMCLAQLSEQSTFSLERRISTANLMISGQGCVARLGGLRWGSEIHGVGQAAETALLRRDDDLCLGLADTLEGLLGLVPGEDGDEAEANNEKLDYTNEMERGARAGASLMLVNILAWLRLPPRSREGITLKILLGHQYFAPLRPANIESDMPAAWKLFIDQGK